MDIERFDPCYDSELDQVVMEENDEGCYVNYSEFLEIQQNLKAMQDEREQLLDDLSQKIFDTSDRKAVDTFNHCPKCDHKCPSPAVAVPESVTENDAADYLAYSKLDRKSAWALGWNECRDQMLSGSPSPRITEQDALDLRRYRFMAFVLRNAPIKAYSTAHPISTPATQNDIVGFWPPEPIKWQIQHR